MREHMLKNPSFPVDQPATYQIVVKGRLDDDWAEWFDYLTVYVRQEPDGNLITTLTGPVPDQSALHGLLARVRDLGLPLLEVHRIPSDSNHEPSTDGL